jgi:hypothetical protein
MVPGIEDPNVVVLEDDTIPDDLPQPEDFDDGSGDITEPDDDDSSETL